MEFLPARRRQNGRTPGGLGFYLHQGRRSPSGAAVTCSRFFDTKEERKFAVGGSIKTVWNRPRVHDSGWRWISAPCSADPPAIKWDSPFRISDPPSGLGQANGDPPSDCAAASAHHQPPHQRLRGFPDRVRHRLAARQRALQSSFRGPGIVADQPARRAPPATRRDTTWRADVQAGFKSTGTISPGSWITRSCPRGK